jgi:hypothetical protein
MVRKFTGAVLALTAAISAPAAAQGLETLGNRAAGLSAFVAVADDVTAVAWNPAGLVTGPFFNVTLDLGRSTTAAEGAVGADGPAGKVSTALIAVGVPPLGLSYYRIGLTAIEPISPAGEGDTRRETRQVAVRTIVASHLGATVLQSLGDHWTVGTTVKLVRGRVGADIVAVDSWGEGFERADTLDTQASTTGDLDVGAMFAAGRVRAGLVVRNVTEPTFGDDEPAGRNFTLKRHARVGVAWGDRWPGTAATIIAVDADLTRVLHPAGERRDVSAGIERWLRPQVGIRGGLRASTLGGARPVASGGLSYAVRAGTFVDGYVAIGDRHARAWGVAARLTY